LKKNTELKSIKEVRGCGPSQEVDLEWRQWTQELPWAPHTCHVHQRAQGMVRQWRGSQNTCAPDSTHLTKNGTWLLSRSLNQGLLLCKELFNCLSHASCPFCSGYFGDGVWQTICPGWCWTAILLLSASQVARIAGVSPWYSAEMCIFLRYMPWWFVKHMHCENITRSSY
jgi:hypothetical protein